jgi:hypothetical protein
LIFNIQAQFKNPLLIKPRTLSLGFHGDKHFYSVQELHLPASKANKELMKFIRVFEYDLHNFEKIRVQDLKHPEFAKFKKSDKKRGLVGKVKEGGFFKIFSTV